MFTKHQPLRTAKSIQDAAQESPVLAKIGTLLKQSNQMLLSIQHLLPAGLKAGIKAGPIDEQTWCLLVSNTAVANKLRHLTPDIERHINGATCSNLRLRIKIL